MWCHVMLHHGSCSQTLRLLTCLHLQRKPSMSRFSISSMTVMSGARTDTTPSSSGRKGWGLSWDKKEAKPRKDWFSVALAESE